MSGQAMIREIRKYEAQLKVHPTPVIIVSGEPDEHEKDYCLDSLGARAFLQKPVVLQDLVQMILSTLKQTKSHLKIEGTILIVDDERVTAKLMSQILTQEHYNNIVAHTVESVLTPLSVYRHSHYTRSSTIRLSSSSLTARSPMAPAATSWSRKKSLRVFKQLMGIGSKQREVRPFIVSISGNSVEDQRKLYAAFTIDEFLCKPIPKRKLLEVLLALPKRRRT